MTPFEKVANFIERSAVSPNPGISSLAAQLFGAPGHNTTPTNSANPDEDITEDTDPSATEQNKADKDNIEGRIIENSFPDIDLIEAQDKNEDVTTKHASAFIKDVMYKDLPPVIRKEVDRFVDCAPDTLLIHYGMVVRELLSKVDKHNFDSAKKNLSGEEIDKGELLDKLKTKHIIVLNDRIIDGHHALAKADKAGVTSSLNVLDITPSRFQKTATLWDLLQR